MQLTVTVSVPSGPYCNNCAFKSSLYCKLFDVFVQRAQVKTNGFRKAQQCLEAINEAKCKEALNGEVSKS
jgi:hypothetical protein